MAFDDGPGFDRDDISFAQLREEESMAEIQDQIDALDEARAEALERASEAYDDKYGYDSGFYDD